MPNASIQGRTPLSSIPEQYLEPIQQGTLKYEWKGVPCFKNPFDFALYTALIWQEKPGTMIEVGTYCGGSALWFADLTRSYGLDTRILSVDIEPFNAFTDPRIEFLCGDGNDLGKTLTDDIMASLPRPLIVIDDASHVYKPTLSSLRFFDRWMRQGEHLIVEDGIIDSFSREDRFEGGPNRAIADFLAETGDRYEIATEYCDFFGTNVTWNTNGYLRRR